MELQGFSFVMKGGSCGPVACGWWVVKRWRWLINGSYFRWVSELWRVRLSLPDNAPHERDSVQICTILGVGHFCWYTLWLTLQSSVASDIWGTRSKRRRFVGGPFSIFAYLFIYYKFKPPCKEKGCQITSWWFMGNLVFFIFYFFKPNYNRCKLKFP